MPLTVMLTALTPITALAVAVTAPAPAGGEAIVTVGMEVYAPPDVNETPDTVPPTGTL